MGKYPLAETSVAWISWVYALLKPSVWDFFLYIYAMISHPLMILVNFMLKKGI